MNTFDDEKIIIDTYKKAIKSSQIKYIGSFFRCFRIKKLTKSFLFSKSWINSSAKSDMPPDFHNNKHHLMMEVMRVDDCVNKIDGKHVSNSFERTNNCLKNIFGKDYKETRDNIPIYFIPDTRNSNEYNFEGYLKNFARIINKHSSKIENYHKNYPQCKEVIFFICDESNNYVQVSKEEDLKKENNPNVYVKNALIHCHFFDNDFLDIIKNCKADYVIWMGYYKSIFVNDKEIKFPKVCIYDVKNIKINGHKYNHELMLKVKNEV